MTPREAADRLFARVMTAVDQDNGDEVRTFLPMALGAYDQARPLDADGFFHLAMLRQIGGDASGALVAAREGLAIDPDHLLNLAAAAGATDAIGDSAGALELYMRLVEVYDSEIEKGHPDYEAHARLLPGMRQAALDYIAGGGE